MFPVSDTAPTKRTIPVVNFTIMLIASLVYLNQIDFSLDENDDFIQKHGFNPSLFTEVSLLTLFTRSITALFVHQTDWHFVLSIYGLWIFGRAVEKQLGELIHSVNFIVLGFIGWGGYALFNPEGYSYIVGLTLPVVAYMGYFLTAFRTARIDMLFFLVIIPIFFRITPWIVVAGWLLLFLWLMPQLTAAYAWTLITMFIVGLMMGKWVDYWLKLKQKHHNHDNPYC